MESRALPSTKPAAVAPAGDGIWDHLLPLHRPSPTSRAGLRTRWSRLGAGYSHLSAAAPKL